MILPFVREILADAEKSTAFQRAASHLKTRAERTSVSGLTQTAKALHIPLLRRATSKALIVVVANNRAAEDLLPQVQAFADLTGAVKPSSVVVLPAHDVLPFENQSPHPEIQESRATALWKIATGEAEIVIAPLESASMRLHPAEFYADLARVIHRTDAMDTEKLVEHLNIVGYAATDVVEMPGQYALRGGILDVFPPETERPLRIELFGDEVESIRRFDPTTQRSSTPVDEAVLLPLSETPVNEQMLAVIHARLSSARVGGSEQSVTEAITAGGGRTFSWWGGCSSAAGGEQTGFWLLAD